MSILRRLAVILVAVSSAVLITGTAGTATGSEAAPRVDWTQYHGTADHRGFNPAEREVNADNVMNLSLSWIGNGARVGADLVVKSSPTVVAGVVYFGTFGGQLLAFRTPVRIRPASRCGG